jgi:hypothetical protein
MIRSTALALSALMLLAACGERANTSTPPGAAPQASAPAVALPATPLPPLPSTSGVSPSATAKDSPATDPKGTLTKEEEAKSMPMAGHGNNHSSPSLESTPGK